MPHSTNYGNDRTHKRLASTQWLETYKLLSHHGTNKIEEDYDQIQMACLHFNKNITTDQVSHKI